MSILINGMELPKDECVGIFVYPDGRVHVWRSMSLVGQEYKAVPVPAHGRLIDADANLSVMRRVQANPYIDHGKIDTVMLKACIKMFEEAPTVIPASKEVEK